MKPEQLGLKAAGLTLVLCSLAFVAVFTYLAATFGYPEVLDRSAGEVLPRLAAGGDTLRNVWFLYGLLPLGIVFAGAASASVLARGGQPLRALGLSASTLAGIAMMAGLLRWPTIMEVLARYWQNAAPAERPALAAIFDAANLFMGQLVGEFVGEIALATWFMALALAFRRTGRRFLGILGIASAALVALAALRNITTAVAPIAEINNVTLPLWLLVLGVLFFRDGLGKPLRTGKLQHEMPEASAASGV
jgi:hypothetical protein